VAEWVRRKERGEHTGHWTLGYICAYVFLNGQIIVLTQWKCNKPHFIIRGFYVCVIFTRAFEKESHWHLRKTREKPWSYSNIIVLVRISFSLGFPRTPPTSTHAHPLSLPLSLWAVSLAHMAIQGQSTSTSRGQMSMAFHFCFGLSWLLVFCFFFNIYSGLSGSLGDSMRAKRRK